MPSPSTPGVYIKEISTLPASIAAVATAIPAFIGYTEKAVKQGADVTGEPIRITSMLEYQEWFGGPNEENLTLEIKDVYDDQNVLISRNFEAGLTTASGYNLYHSLVMFFNNGGGTCYIVSVGSYSDTVIVGTGLTAFPAGGLTGGINALEVVDEPTLLVFPDAVNLADETAYGMVVKSALMHCNKLQDRFTIADVKHNGTANAITNYRDALGNDFLKYGAAYYPSLRTTLNHGYPNTLAVNYSKTGGSSPPDPDFANKTLNQLENEHPSIYRSVIASIRNVYVTLPPSGSVAGIYARVDADRGVWKAPANVGVNSIIGPTVKLTNSDQDLLNVDAASGKSINAIRTFAGKGTLVWGARTLAGNDNEWRYVPVRRLYIFVEESIKKATEFVVFEPNTANTWVRVKGMIENFLTALWREGALAGAAPEDAFFVKIGLGETMTPQEILEGIMNVEIGMAAVRPAEFIILKFSHKLQVS